MWPCALLRLQTNSNTDVSWLTSLSSPAATVIMSPVSLLIVNMLGEGLLGAWDRILYLSIPLRAFGSSASIAVTVITYVPRQSRRGKWMVTLHVSVSQTEGIFTFSTNLHSTFSKQHVIVSTWLKTLLIRTVLNSKNTEHGCDAWKENFFFLIYIYKDSMFPYT